MSSTVNRIAAVGALVVAALLSGYDMQNKNPELTTTSSGCQEKTARTADSAQMETGTGLKLQIDP